MAYVGNTHAEHVADNRWLNKFVEKYHRVIDRLQEARLHEARRQIAPYLSNLDDETLKALGFDRNELKSRL